MAEGLTNKQRAFIEAYLACGFNATEAARRAGYSEKTARSIGAENLTKPDIVAEISRRMADMAMPADEALARLAEHARGDIRAFVSTDERGIPDGFSLSADRPLHRVKKVSVTDKGWSFEMYDAQAAIVNILKVHGKFVDRVAIESELQAALERLHAGLTPDEYAKVAAILIAGDSGA